MRLKYLAGLAFMAFPFVMGAQTLETINDPTVKIKELDEVGPFSEGLAAVRKDGKWGFIDQEGNLVIDLEVVWFGTKMPELTASFISPDLILIKTSDNDFQISNISEQIQKP